MQHLIKTASQEVSLMTFNHQDIRKSLWAGRVHIKQLLWDEWKHQVCNHGECTLLRSVLTWDVGLISKMTFSSADGQTSAMFSSLCALVIRPVTDRIRRTAGSVWCPKMEHLQITTQKKSWRREKQEDRRVTEVYWAQAGNKPPFDKISRSISSLLPSHRPHGCWPLKGPSHLSPYVLIRCLFTQIKDRIEC